MSQTTMHSSLYGLTLGDAFGQQFFIDRPVAEGWMAARAAPPAPWFYTDDSAQAMVLVRHLQEHGRVLPDALADGLAEEYQRQPMRGYGGTTHQILRAIGQGDAWQQVSQAVFSGSGSMGNGAAMRVAPLGAYFCDDLDMTAEQAHLSALPTHAHPEAQAGAVAVAVAAALAASTTLVGPELLHAVAEHVPQSATRMGIVRAAGMGPHTSVTHAVFSLGNGANLLTQRTVPFALWVASRNLHSFQDAMWETVAGWGDRDTNCAIVGGVLAARVGAAALPEWGDRLLEFPHGWPASLPGMLFKGET